MKAMDIINAVIRDEYVTGDYLDTTKMDIIKSEPVNKNVYNYLKQILNNLNISICGEYNGYLLELMNRGTLEGWCWETTETAIVFFNDDDYIERGTLVLANNSEDKYYHSWICFKYENEEYVLDPCLNFLCDKNLYYEILEVKENGKVSAKEVREELIKQIEVGLNEKKYNECDSMLSKFYGIEINNQKVFVSGNDDINSPMYRNNTSYVAEIENNKVKKLNAYYHIKG